MSLCLCDHLSPYEPKTDLAVPLEAVAIFLGLFLLSLSMHALFPSHTLGVLTTLGLHTAFYHPIFRSLLSLGGGIGTTIAQLRVDREQPRRGATDA